MASPPPARPATADGPLRLFFGVPLAPALRTALARETARRLRQPPWRPSHPDTLHLTLRFLGDQPAERLSAFVAAGASVAAAATPFVLALGALTGLPTPLRARVAVLAVDDGLDEAANLAAALDRQLAAVGVEPERRSFFPHLTLARTREFAPVPPGRIETRFTAAELVLWQSHLGGPHARHEALARWPLGDAPA